MHKDFIRDKDNFININRYFKLCESLGFFAGLSEIFAEKNYILRNSKLLRESLRNNFVNPKTQAAF